MLYLIKNGDERIIMTHNLQSRSGHLSARQQKLQEIWEAHTRYEFEIKSVAETMETMTSHPYVYNIPSMRGGEGFNGVSGFYSESFIPQIPPDTETVLITRTIGENQIVDELIFKFTHTIQMDWMLPGIAPTGKRVEVPLVAIVGFDEDKISHEHIYWDQGSVLCQIGLLDKGTLPVTGKESAQYISKKQTHQ